MATVWRLYGDRQGGQEGHVLLKYGSGSRGMVGMGRQLLVPNSKPYRTYPFFEGCSYRGLPIGNSPRLPVIHLDIDYLQSSGVSCFRFFNQQGPALFGEELHCYRWN